MAEKVNTYRTTARIVGLLFVAGMVIGIGGNVLILSILGVPDPLSNVSASSILVAVAASLWLMTVVGDAAHGVLMFPILKRQSERIAIGYLAARIVDAVFIAVMVLFILGQIPLASEYLKAGPSDASYLQALSTMFVDVNLYAYHIAMFTLGIAGLLLCYTFYRAKLVPRPLAVWGLIGYATILCGSLLEILGFNLLSIHAIPGGLWELFIGVWLIARGFNPSAFVPESAGPDDDGWTSVREPAAVASRERV
jgi:Domain of unknown function (DUF4386)